MEFVITPSYYGHDLVLENGDLKVTTNLQDIIVQRVIYRCHTWLGESPYDTASGIPYIDGVFDNAAIDAVVGLLVNEVEQVDGVDSVIGAPTYSIGADRKLRLEFSVSILEEDIPITLEIGGD